jgi:transcriptional regulator with PAS, ATPase and Fis domain
VEDPDLVKTASQGLPETAPRDRVFQLTLTSGPDKGRRIRIDASAPRLLVGQSEVCEVRLADREVSRRHAAIEHLGWALRIQDLRSTNGTMVDRVRVVEALLTGGEIVRVGTTTLRVDEVGAADATTPTSPGEPRAFGRVVGESPAMRALYPTFARIANASLPVIIEGETGTGKEVLAEALHEAGPRANGPFIIFDCTMAAPTLIESELFGHASGAFGGTTTPRAGVFEQAHGGTLFIDEIGDLPLELQPKLLRVLERSEVRRVGGDSWIQVDVRVLAATRRDLDREVEEGRFREDLFHRLAGAQVMLPPLSRRTGDVAVLARLFWERLGGDPRSLP